MWASWVVSLAALLLPALAHAKDTRLETLLTADDTKGWEAVGRLNLGHTGFCTGALIAPDLVLTAAHCLFDKTTGNAFPADEIEFLAGWRNGRASAYRGVRRAIPHPDYIYEGPEKMDRVAYDLAVLELDQPIRLPSIRPFATDSEPSDGEEVGIVSYALDRSEAPSLQKSCEVLGRQPGIIIMSCEVDFGSSGAPVFSMRDGEVRIVSVVSAKAEMNKKLVALGTAMTVPLGELMAAIQNGTAVSTKSLPKVRMLGSTAGGAKFVKP